MGELIVSKLKKNNLIAHANSLIESRYSITKNEQILLFAMISLINPNDKEFVFSETGPLHGPYASPEKHNMFCIKTKDYKLMYNKDGSEKSIETIALFRTIASHFSK